jgi:hypothetical protein
MATVFCIVDVVFEKHLQNYKHKRKRFSFYFIDEIMTGMEEDIYSETSIHRFRWGSEKETMDPRKQQMQEP